jgi:hypothetical protein
MPQKEKKNLDVWLMIECLSSSTKPWVQFLTAKKKKARFGAQAYNPASQEMR